MLPPILSVSLYGNCAATSFRFSVLTSAPPSAAFSRNACSASVGSSLSHERTVTVVIRSGFLLYTPATSSIFGATTADLSMTSVVSPFSFSGTVRFLIIAPLRSIRRTKLILYILMNSSTNGINIQISQPQALIAIPRTFVFLPVSTCKSTPSTHITTAAIASGRRSFTQVFS